MSLTPARTGDAFATDAEVLAESARAARELGLHQMGVRPTLRTYIVETWRRRQFVHSLAISKAYAENQNNYLGQLWAVLNPALNAIVYVIIFGFILKADRGLENTVAFIVVGTFIYRFFSDSVTAGAKSITGNLNLVRSLHFPRAVLPLSAVLSLLASLLPALAVMLAFIVASGYFPNSEPVPITARWLLLVPAVGVTYVFSTGIAFMTARAVANVPDLMNTIPFITRMLMYASGVLFPIGHYVSNPVLTGILDYQPVAVVLNLARQAVTDEPNIPLDPVMWAVGAGWAILALVIGFVVFWRAEARYGRE
ncbi:transport permease protein [Flavimobilis marinus]|uniref:Transport permease protein n=1 Tax=Flavimobilis marinus TaxID=285351 RepID=A0A1I2HHK7_9MICO|nr:ABC transporter permease [Flavimobilis marinus]GHG57412.1 transport permease protein [Flavimobilis marinus]SFF29172.1 teichoic acid transport system permease protein [Flavimobilis marinus]